MDFFNTVEKYISTKANYETAMMEQELAICQQQTIHQCNTHAQLQLQDALFQVMCRASISPQLCRLNNADELLPCGYQLTNDTTVYYFAWTKNNSDMIATSSLHRFTRKMNTFILTAHRRFLMHLQQYDYCTQANLIQMNGVLYNGFQVIGCKDDGDCIILAVTYL